MSKYTHVATIKTTDAKNGKEHEVKVTRSSQDSLLMVCTLGLAGSSSYIIEQDGKYITSVDNHDEAVKQAMEMAGTL